MFLTKLPEKLQDISRTGTAVFGPFSHIRQAISMARFTREGSLVRIFATTTQGEERIIAAARLGTKRNINRGTALYDYGTGRTYYRYQVGCAPAKSRWFKDSAEDIQAAFRAAGLTPPKARPARFIRRIIASFLRPRAEGEAAPAQRIG